jgi:hypothetical protein
VAIVTLTLSPAVNFIVMDLVNEVPEAIFE